MDLQDPEQRRIQLNSSFQIFVATLFLILPIFMLENTIKEFDPKYILSDIILILILLFSLVMAYRMKDLKRVSFDPTHFYVRSIFKNNETMLPISSITEFKKAFTGLRHTDMFLIRYKDYDGQNKLIKIMRSMEDQSILTFTKLIKLNKTNDGKLRGIVENKF